MGDTVIINGKAAVHSGSAGKVMFFPDVCLSPPGPPAGPVPIPYMNTAVAADLAGGAATVFIEGNPVGHIDSFIAKSTGDEVAQSTGGGVLSHTVQGKAHFLTGSLDVLIEGKPAVFHGSLMTGNHMARIPGNTPPGVWMSTMIPPDVTPARSSKTLREGKDFIDILVVDAEGLPVQYESYEVTTPAGTKVPGVTLKDGGIHLKGLKPGKCLVSLPKRDRKAATSPLPRTAQHGKLYKAGVAMSLETGKEHKLETGEGPSYWLHLPINRRDAKLADDKFTLRSKDGKYVVDRTVRDDHGHGGIGLLLEFPDLRRGRQYSLIHDQGEDGSVSAMFEDLSFEAIFQPTPTVEPEPETSGDDETA
jgi:uncharacterized Zn-binding protein involved in type VI secretion